MRNQRTIKVTRFVFCALACLAHAAWGQDPFPEEATMFFNLNVCPSGWESYSEADGRLLVPMPTGAGQQVNNGLAPGAEPQHKHSFDASIELTSVSYVLVAGCGNNCLARADRYPFNGITDPGGTGLPYVQLNVCIKTGTVSGGTIPTGLMSYFFRRRCPGGWQQVLPAQGRMLVGLPAGGAPEASFGGPPLAPGSDRSHRHPFSGSVSTRKQDIAGAPGCCAGGYGGNGSYQYNGVSGDSSSNWPYIQLLLCRKD